jgi:hypothetical protein
LRIPSQNIQNIPKYYFKTFFIFLHKLFVVEKNYFFKFWIFFKIILICAKATQVLSLILLSLSPWRLWRENLTRHLVVSGSCHLSLGVLSKEEKTNQKKASNS